MTRKLFSSRNFASKLGQSNYSPLLAFVLLPLRGQLVNCWHIDAPVWSHNCWQTLSVT